MEQFVQLQMLFHRYHLQNARNLGLFNNPHRGQGRVLAILKLKPEISQRELGFLLNVSKQALAELLGKLEKSGYITREAAEEDRRVSNIKLTEAGAAAADEMGDVEPETDKVLDCLNDEELQQLGGYLDRIIQKLRGQFPDDDNDPRGQMVERFRQRRQQMMEEFRGRPGPHCGPGHHPFGGLGGCFGRRGGGFGYGWGGER